MAKFNLYMIETLYHVVEVEADNEKEVREMFNRNETDWGSAECYDATVNIDEIIEKKNKEEWEGYCGRSWLKELVSKSFQDVHIQLNLVNADEKENQALKDYDLILRANDEGTEYTSFDIFNVELQKPIATIKLDGSEAWTYE